MTNKLTERQALEMTRDLWKWIADTGATTKMNWPGWARMGRPYIPNWCACCEYSKQITGTLPYGSGDPCAPCPMKDHWPNGCEPSDDEGVTIEGITDWQQWMDENRNRNFQAANKLALSIHNAAIEALAKLDEREKQTE